MPACFWFVYILVIRHVNIYSESFHKITLRDQGTPEQHELFLKKAENYEFIGCYAQTELGHGSNVRGLETTATWNANDKTFTLHSPHLTASKWWIGSMGRTANHAVVMAQLMIDGKSYGPHPFVVQIRDMKTHEPLKDIHVGDIGPKFGYNTMDNGFLLLNHVKVPHAHMLAKFSSVDPKTNRYVKPASASLVYGTLVSFVSPFLPDLDYLLAYKASRRNKSRDLFNDPRKILLTDQLYRLGFEAL